jgi:Spy/CpxP family protein refolding chaperone
MNTAALKAKIEGARRRLQKAETEMERALHEIGGAPRADKSIISGALSTAFSEMKAARQDLLDLEQVIAEDG